MDAEPKTAAQEAQEKDPMIGQTIDVYLITSLIGEGGMGRVYQALHQRLDRLVAFKILPGNLMYDQVYRLRFQKEARAAARLNHPNIVQIYDFNEENGITYLVMEFVDGKNLKTLLEKEGIFPSRDAMEMLLQACHALGHAHEAGVVHRDIKPDNFILSDIGVLKLADLGLAKLGLQGDAQSAGLTQTGSTLGTPYYISPELIQADPADHRTDIYSLGATFYHLVTGVPPFVGKSSPLIMAKHLHELPADPRTLNPEIDPVLAEVLMFMLEKNPDKRPQSILEVAHRLETHLRDLMQAALQEELQASSEGAAVLEPAPDEPSPEKDLEEPSPLPPPKAADRRPEKTSVIPPDESRVENPALFPEELFEDLIQQLRFVLGDETEQHLEIAFENTGLTAASLRLQDFNAFARELQKSVSIMDKREKVKGLCTKIWSRSQAAPAEEARTNEKCLSLLYMTQLRRLVKKYSKDHHIDIVDQCLDILELNPRRIPASRREDLLNEIEFQIANPARQKQFRYEVQYIANS